MWVRLTCSRSRLALFLSFRPVSVHTVSNFDLLFSSFFESVFMIKYHLNDPSRNLKIINDWTELISRRSGRAGQESAGYAWAVKKIVARLHKKEWVACPYGPEWTKVTLNGSFLESNCSPYLFSPKTRGKNQIVAAMTGRLLLFRRRATEQNRRPVDRSINQSKNNWFQPEKEILVQNRQQSLSCKYFANTLKSWIRSTIRKINLAYKEGNVGRF